MQKVAMLSQQYKQKKTGEDNRKIAFPCILYSKGV
jgi:hypothetical protein